MPNLFKLLSVALEAFCMQSLGVTCLTLMGHAKESLSVTALTGPRPDGPFPLTLSNRLILNPLHVLWDSPFN